MFLISSGPIIDLEKGIIRLIEVKTGAVRIIVLNSDMIALLRAFQ